MRLKVRKNGGKLIVNEQEPEEEEEVVFLDSDDMDDTITEIVQITDADTGEKLHFEIDEDPYLHKS